MHPGIKSARGRLVRHIGVLDRLVRESHEPRLQTAPGFRGFAAELDQLDYFLRSAHAAISRLETELTAVAARLAVDTVAGTRRMAESWEQDAMAFATDQYLTSARRAQDAVTRYLRRVPGGKNLPESLNDVVKAIESGDRDFGERINVATTSYWVTSGRRLKAYRDRLHHTASLCGDCWGHRGADGQIWLTFPLPNNPEKASPKLWSYSPPVEAMGYSIGSFLELVGFLDEVVDGMIDLLAPAETEAARVAVRTESVLIMSFRNGPVVGGHNPVGLAFPLEASVDDKILEFIKRRTRQGSTGTMAR